MARRRKRGSRLSLPWEQRLSVLLTPSSGQLWPLLLTALALSMLLGLHQLGERRLDELVTRATLSEVERGARAFLLEVGRCPHGPSELVHPPRSGRQYLGEEPFDVWGNAIRLHCKAPDTDSIEAISAGPSGSFFDEDNVM